MKRIFSVMLVALMVLSATIIKVDVVKGDDFKFDSNETIKEMEIQKGIEVKRDSEVFSIIKSRDNFEIYFIEKDTSLSFTPTIDEESNATSKMTVLNNGFNVATIIGSPDSSTTYELKVEMPSNWTIDYPTFDDGQVINGSLAFYNENDEPIASTGLPIAIDSNGKELNTYFTINNNSIVLNVEISNSNVFPIETNYGIYAVNPARSVTDYFHYAGFNIVYEGSLTLGPRYFDEGSVIDVQNAWDAVVDLFYPYPGYWTDNLNGMTDQYWCHANFAKNKNNWNLEPWRPDVGYWETVLAGCNPE